MKKETIENHAEAIVSMVYAKMLEVENPVQLPTWNGDYWRGYCRAVSEYENFETGELYKMVYKAVIQLCDNIRNKSKNPLSHFISFKK